MARPPRRRTPASGRIWKRRSPPPGRARRRPSAGGLDGGHDVRDPPARLADGADLGELPIRRQPAHPDPPRARSSGSLRTIPDRNAFLPTGRTSSWAMHRQPAHRAAACAPKARVTRPCLSGSCPSCPRGPRITGSVLPAAAVTCMRGMPPSRHKAGKGRRERRQQGERRQAVPAQGGKDVRSGRLPGARRGGGDLRRRGGGRPPAALPVREPARERSGTVPAIARDACAPSRIRCTVGNGRMPAMAQARPSGTRSAGAPKGPKTIRRGDFCNNPPPLQKKKNTLK